VFDVEKLTWLNGRYLRKLSPEAMIALLRSNLLSDAYLAQVIALCRERVDTLEGFFDYASFFFQGEFGYDAAALQALTPKDKTPSEVRKLLAALIEDQIDPLLEWRAPAVEASLKAFAESSGWPAKELFMTVRVAVTGRTATPPLFETMAVLGKEICRRRLRRAAESLK
jgi:glutamyl-tRNA synthetase